MLNISRITVCRQQTIHEKKKHSSALFIDTCCLYFFISVSCLFSQNPAMTQDPVFVNEASTSINNRHVDHRENNPSTHNCLNALLARSNSRRHPNAKISHADTQGWVMGTGYFYSPAGGLGLEHTPSGKNYKQNILKDNSWVLGILISCCIFLLYGSVTLAFFFFFFLPQIYAYIYQ